MAPYGIPVSYYNIKGSLAGGKGGHQRAAVSSVTPTPFPHSGSCVGGGVGGNNLSTLTVPPPPPPRPAINNENLSSFSVLLSETAAYRFAYPDSWALARMETGAKNSTHRHFRKEKKI